MISTPPQILAQVPRSVPANGLRQPRSHETPVFSPRHGYEKKEMLHARTLTLLPAAANILIGRSLGLNMVTCSSRRLPKGVLMMRYARAPGAQRPGSGNLGGRGSGGFQRAAVAQRHVFADYDESSADPSLSEPAAVLAAGGAEQ